MMKSARPSSAIKWQIKRCFFNNSKGKVTLYLNKKGEIVSYEQMYLEGSKKFNKPKELVSAITAIGALYQNGDIDPKSDVTNVKFGILQFAADDICVTFTCANMVGGH
ncbi:two-component system regulatory protein YycI [Peribacillus frigoritolerans]|nr:two-component system regulatory protein YycI [Peribacillus frigoritolerans]